MHMQLVFLMQPLLKNDWWSLLEPARVRDIEITLCAHRIWHRARITETLRVDRSDHEQVDCIGPQSSHSVQGGLYMVCHCLPAIAHWLAKIWTEQSCKEWSESHWKWNWVSMTKVNGWKLNIHTHNTWSVQPNKWNIWMISVYSTTKPSPPNGSAMHNKIKLSPGDVKALC
jgi:hypothetical protein